MTNVTMYWKYRNIYERLIRRKTIYMYVASEDTTIGYQILNNKNIKVVYNKYHKST